MYLFTGSSPRSITFIGHLLAIFIIAHGSATVAYASDMVNINTASIEVPAEELVGVGPELAKRIIDFRERYAEFKSIEALSDVCCIDPSLLTKNEGKIVIE